MSRINFEPLRNKHPELKPAAERLESWYARHSGAVIDPRRLVREINDLGVETLADVMDALVESGEVQQVYCVRDSSGVLISSEQFDSPEDVPEVVTGRFGELVPSSGAITPVFRGVRH